MIRKHDRAVIARMAAETPQAACADFAAGRRRPTEARLRACKIAYAVEELQRTAGTAA